MRATALLALLLMQVAAPAANDSPFLHQRMEREVHLPPGTVGQTCAVLDGDVYAHAGSESLNDVRLFAAVSAAKAPTETPFTLTESNTARTESEPAAVRNLGMENGGITFDLEMPRRPYTAVELALQARDFIGSARVWGRADDGHRVSLGEFAVFDLSAQHLSRSTTLPLQESTFAELHIELQVHAAPGLDQKPFPAGIVTGATIPPSRSAQTLYTTVAATGGWQKRGNNSVATLQLPAHVPVARVLVTVDPSYKSNFLRDVTVSARPDRAAGADSAAEDVETVNGSISQVHLPAATTGAEGPPIDSRQMSLEAVLAANLRGGATVEVAVANGNDPPLPLQSVDLQMRQRGLCFEAAPGGGAYTLMYGDKELPAPVYEYSRLFVASAAPAVATLGPEQPNPQFVPRGDTRPFTERHPELLWLGLFAALTALGGVALRSMRHQRGDLHE